MTTYLAGSDQETRLAIRYARSVVVEFFVETTVYMRARDYTPATGQFLSNDPTGFGGGDWNIRRYVENDPLGLEDQSGSKSQPGYGGSNGQGGTYQGTMNNFFPIRTLRYQAFVSALMMGQRPDFPNLSRRRLA